MLRKTSLQITYILPTEKKYNFTLKIFNIQKLIYVQRISWIAISVKLLYTELICYFKPSSITGMPELLLVFFVVLTTY